MLEANAPIPPPIPPAEGALYRSMTFNSIGVAVKLRMVSGGDMTAALGDFRRIDRTFLGIYTPEEAVSGV
jgi:hypothetical protein